VVISRPLVAAAVVTCGRGVLVSRRLDGAPPWAFVAGAVEPGESPQDAAVREVMEETGMVVAAGSEIGRRDHPVTGRSLVYVAAGPAGPAVARVRDGSGLAEVRWVTLGEAAELMPGIFGPVADHLARTLRR
jgi:8-oxo-dGTP pyrophosphatase MutT (NUDIX family)